ncbi:hypothetical protein T8T21_00790 [Limimaricola variabilis]|uniref:hypothetical protein n=1 Tax=Limimaricola variabilis TaxID=1492771 RepID=UPI002AC98D5F|nr:hypothetical protein [Limimaricola variabilis]WPY94695.1 hypothetical protein T8T21_00790 [Limimaricola variabilis]
MGLGYSGVTLASHLLLIAAILFVFGRAQSMRFVQDSLPKLVASRYMRAALIAALAVMIVERLYYVGARLLSGQGVNLWNAHPAPEILSFTLAAAVYHVSIAALWATGELTSQRYATIATEIAVMLASWALLCVLLW